MRRMFHSLAAKLHLILARRYDQQQGRIPYKHSVDPNLGTGGSGAQKQFARMAAGLLLENLPIGQFGSLNGWSEQMRGFAFVVGSDARERRCLSGGARRSRNGCRSGSFDDCLSVG
jgi:hypothetical protein